MAWIRLDYDQRHIRRRRWANILAGTIGTTMSESYRSPRVLAPLRLLKKSLDRIRHQRQVRRAFATIGREDRRRIDFYSQFVRRGDLVFDVGANIGNRSKAFLALGARVVAFEPQPQCIATLKMSAGNQRNFHLIGKALGAAEGTAEMHLSDVDVLSSLSAEWISATQASGRFESISWNRKAVVQVTTLDAMISTFGIPSFIKIDVEGFEYEVIAGLSHVVPCLSFEFTAEYIDVCHRALQHLGQLERIECRISHAESLAFTGPEWMSAEAVMRELAGAGPLAAGDLYVRMVDRPV